MKNTNILVGITNSGKTKMIFDYLKEIIKITNKNIKVHIKIDTGMNRLGVSSKNELNEIVHIINSNKNIYLEGLFTIRCTSRGRVE